MFTDLCLWLRLLPSLSNALSVPTECHYLIPTFVTFSHPSNARSCPQHCMYILNQMKISLLFASRTVYSCATASIRHALALDLFKHVDCVFHKIRLISVHSAAETLHFCTCNIMKIVVKSKYTLIMC